MPTPEYFYSRAEAYRLLALNEKDEIRAGDFFEIEAMFRSLAMDLAKLRDTGRNPGGGPAAAPLRTAPVTFLFRLYCVVIATANLTVSSSRR